MIEKRFAADVTLEEVNNTTLGLVELDLKYVLLRSTYPLIIL